MLTRRLVRDRPVESADLFCRNSENKVIREKILSIRRTTVVRYVIGQLSVVSVKTHKNPKYLPIHLPPLQKKSGNLNILSYASRCVCDDVDINPALVRSIFRFGLAGLGSGPLFDSYLCLS